MTTHKSVILSAFALLAMLTGAPVSATPGKTNTAGCHKSKAAGYHCHGGKPATKGKTGKRATR